MLQAPFSIMEIIPTVVPGSLKDIEKLVNIWGHVSRSLHIDVTDGVFAPNRTWMPTGVEMLPKVDGLIYEAHLMVSDPRSVGVSFARAGATRIIGHLEAMGEQVPSIIEEWKHAGARETGLGVLFDTPIEMLDPYVALCDVVQMMSIGSIGVQGIPYEPSAPARIAQLHSRHPGLLIADDGGVSEKNIAQLARAGVRRFCVGSALSTSTDPASTYRSLIALAESALE